MVEHPGAAGLGHRSELARIGHHVLECGAQALDDRGPRPDRDLEPGAGGDKLARAGVVDDQRHQPQRHRLENHAAAEFADRGEGEHMTAPGDAFDLAVGQPAVKGDGRVGAFFGDLGAQLVHHRAIADHLEGHGP